MSNPRLTKPELIRLITSSVISSVICCLIMRPCGPRDFVLALFVAGVVLAFAEVFCDSDE